MIYRSKEVGSGAAMDDVPFRSSTLAWTDRVKLVNKSVHLDDKSHTVIGELYEQEFFAHC